MDKTIKLGLGQINITPADLFGNFEKIKEYVKKSKKEKCDLVIFPEMAISGYLLSDLWEDDAFVTEVDRYTDEVRKLSKGITIIFGNVMSDFRPSLFDPKRKAFGNDGRTKKFNCAFVVSNGKFVENVRAKYKTKDIFPRRGVAIKTNEPLYREFEDQRHFLPLKEYSQQLGIELSDLINPFEIKTGTKKTIIGVLICEDVWIQDYVYNDKILNPAKILKEKGAEIIIAISASPFGWRKEEARLKNINEVQKEIGIPLVYVNNVGEQNNGKNEYVFDGKSTVFDANGKPDFMAPSWQEGLFFYSVDIAKSKNFVPYIRTRNKTQEREELYQSLVFGIREFARQKNIKNFLIGMSGGIDSSLVAYLCVQALGKDRVLGVNMPTRFNSDWTKDIAKVVADRLGIKYTTVPIEDLANNVREKISQVNFDRDYGKYSSTNKDRVIDENLQARIRSADILAGISAKYDHTVYTSNGNKSEILLGWFTIDGDGRGAICPIADLYKLDIIDLCAHINEKEEIIPWDLIAPLFDPKRYYDTGETDRHIIPENTKPLVPSAELSENQDVTKGRGDPIIFPYHDPLLKQFVEYRKNPEDVLSSFEKGSYAGLAKFLDMDEQTLRTVFAKNFPSTKDWIEDLERIWKLFHLAIYKQIQSPPIISISKRALGFDFRRSQLPPVFTRKYQIAKKSLMA